MKKLAPSVTTSVTIFAFVGATACSDWTPIRSAHDIEGQMVKVEAAGGKETVIDAVVMCDDKGFVIANEASDCHDGANPTFDTRRDKVMVHSDAKSSVGLVVTGILAAILIPAAIVGTTILTSH